MARVELQAVTKRFSPSAVAVDNIDLEIVDREFLVLVGPSGCGKSTTLRLIAGLEQCDEGTIRIGDRVVNQVAPKDRDIAMVFQNYALYPHMSVYRNLSFGLYLRFGGGILSRVVSRLFQPRQAAEKAARRREIHDRVTTTADRLGISHLLNRKPHQLSGGERQRVALGRAIVRNPAAFLFDEPLSNLDAKLRGQLRTEIKRLHEQLETTMIYVTHDQIEAMTLGDRIAVMNEGKIQQLGKPLDVYRQPQNLFVARFIGSLPMNLLKGKVVQEGSARIFESPTATIKFAEEDAIPVAEGREVVLGIRPENIKVCPVEDSGGSQASFGEAVSRMRVRSFDSLGDSTVVFLESESTRDNSRLGESKLKDSRFEDRKQNEDHESRLKGSGREEQSEVQSEISEILVRADAFSDIRPGQTVDMELEMKFAHWFDPQSGNRIVGHN